MNKILVFVVMGLVFAMAFQNKGCNNRNLKADTVTLRDTAWQVRDSLIVKKLNIKQIIHDTLPAEYIADTN